MFGLLRGILTDHSVGELREKVGINVWDEDRLFFVHVREGQYFSTSNAAGGGSASR
ncbi:hypothetical protein PC116_g24341 [Phytophthora cactorum]|nr:hypothetical protein PC114_g21963 [Phytophthora cactorum]KAG2979282.1 hypothetical protein PC119_g21519 [Phytophthora cactorum]KAG3134390.1 hypothetical protein C6341_g22181 [Phytophthora cactorum]KAG3153031.1 hypothetical protein PC128_g22644 [Phytophthora cactorum]KAG4040475.1 hypothetical protein PC123_g23985 [Phytophthora cactorum]